MAISRPDKLERGKKARAGDGPGSLDADAMYKRALRLAKLGREAQAHKVLPLLRGAAEAGHAMAAHALASWYIHGIGVRKNYAAAMELEKIAARAGIAEAMYNLAFAYEAGKGVDKNTQKAFRFYRRAARMGDLDAMHEVGRCLFYGIGTPKNERLGRRWLNKSMTFSNDQASKSREAR